MVVKTCQVASALPQQKGDAVKAAQKMTVDTEKHLGKANDVLKAPRVSYTEKFE